MEWKCCNKLRSNEIDYQVSHDHRSYERNLSNCEQKPKKVRTSTGFEPVTSGHGLIMAYLIMAYLIMAYLITNPQFNI